MWAHHVRKANDGPLRVQSLSEDIAKHLKNDYLTKQKYKPPSNWQSHKKWTTRLPLLCR